MRISISGQLSALALTLLYVAVNVQSSTVKNRLIKTNDISHATRAQIPSDSQLTPVILLPGDGGSRLQARLNRRDVAHHYCERKTNDWFDLWLNLSLLVPFALDCWVDK